jgi:hypothetical protein
MIRNGGLSPSKRSPCLAADSFEKANGGPPFILVTNQWYKNVADVIGIHAEYCRLVKMPVSL